MDPNATLQMIQEHLEDGNMPEAGILAEDLARWLVRGGFEPDWSKHPRATRFYRACAHLDMNWRTLHK